MVQYLSIFPDIRLLLLVTLISLISRHLQEARVTKIESGLHLHRRRKLVTLVDDQAQSGYPQWHRDCQCTGPAPSTKLRSVFLLVPGIDQALEP